MRPPSRDTERRRRRSIRRAESMRNPSNDRNAADMLKFVRDVQFDRQNTASNLNIRAPLPKICENKLTKHGSFDSGFDRVMDADDNEDDSSDELAVACAHKPKIDSELIDMLMHPKYIHTNSKDEKVLAKLRHNQNLDSVNNNNVSKSKVKHNYSDVSGLTNATNVKYRCARLPPLQRDPFPERPSAPSPGQTTSDFSEENDSEIGEYGYV